ncbi:ADR201Wp [Eremothecium gossypii ATCC 10895]|uniref:ADR201Wp n=1 Tax=Eremothecium gossypii (strain ATCC 10895 / CBS 109.51 / FGSC 9923 / NRRL Y-1056) TaxID=284811 RepID=Q759S2_EREGS|nr:ADR201Wp [Eremothecium gossypii ATCC 10895]AAS52121.1 ADR201Wp [Eremothecium gossypii ATCC 10895]AEY96420.1 FADR201Wp [Eremothecium gossypii FDAG1]
MACTPNMQNHRETLAAEATRPATITVRVIKSFPYRNVKSFVLHGYDLERKTAKDLLADAKAHLQSAAAFRAFRTVEYDALKIYTHAHGSKTVNLVINLNRDEWVLDVTDGVRSLAEWGVRDETELSLFNMAAYREYAADPEDRWV